MVEPEKEVYNSIECVIDAFMHVFPGIRRTIYNGDNLAYIVTEQDSGQRYYVIDFTRPMEYDMISYQDSMEQSIDNILEQVNSEGGHC